MVNAQQLNVEWINLVIITRISNVVNLRIAFYKNNKLLIIVTHLFNLITIGIDFKSFIT
jgi:hypothetical protein